MLRLAIRPCVVPIAVVLCVLAGVLPVSAQGVSVTSAEPATGEQDTLSLDVRVKGKNFAPGATAEFLLDDDTTGGITVNRTTFVSATEVVANVTIAAGATLTLFDIRVQNSNGRTGRGSDLFQVVEKGARAGGSCVLQPVPSGVALVGQLNGLTAGAPDYVGGLGLAVHAREVTINGIPTVMVASNANRQVAVFFLSDDGAGGVSVGAANPTRVLSTGFTVPQIQIGDVNADGLPDIVAGGGVDAKVALFLGMLQPDLSLNFSGQIAIPPQNTLATNFGNGVAVGDLDPGLPGDEIAIAQGFYQKGKTKSPGTVYLYRYTGGAVVALTTNAVVLPSVNPAMKLDDLFPKFNASRPPMAIADVVGTADPDLILLAPGREVGGITDAGEIWVLPGPVSSLDADGSLAGLQPYQLRSETPASGHSFGNAIGVGDANGDGELDVFTAASIFDGNARGEVVLGPVFQGQTSASNYVLQPALGGLENGLGSTGLDIADLNGDGLADVAVGAPNAGSSGCTSAGAVHLFFGTGQPVSPWRPVLVLQAPTVDTDFAAFGSTTTPIQIGSTTYLLVGEQGRDLGGFTSAGQIYIYRIGLP